MSTLIEINQDLELLEKIEKERQLVLYNDDHNTFDWVIECLISILGYSSTRAEQLTLIVHFKGKATIKSGSFEELSPYKDSLNDKGLNSVIE